MASSAEALMDVPTDKLMKELQRRLDCLSKSEKRIILVGAHWGQPLPRRGARLLHRLPQRVVITDYIIPKVLQVVLPAARRP